jgi:hypothetical protein
MDLCKDCGKEPREDGKVRCVKCSIRVWQRTVKKTYRDKLRAIEYRGGKCERCGFDDLSILDLFDFHHLEDKKEIMSKMFGRRGWEAIKQEADKCVLLCAVCHRKEHYFLRKGEEQERLKLLPKKSTEWPAKDLELLYFLDGYSMKQIHNLLPHYSVQNIRDQAKEIGVTLTSHKNRPWTDEDVVEVVALWKDCGDVKQIWKQNGTRSYKSIQDKLEELGWLNKQILELPKIDLLQPSNISCYFYGLIWGCGGISVTGNTVYISSKDEKWLGILHRITGGKLGHNKLVFGNTKLVAFLYEKGLSIREGKIAFSYPLTLFTNPEYEEFFLRGYFETKSYISTNPSLRIGFCGNPLVLRGIQEWAKQHMLAEDLQVKKRFKGSRNGDVKEICELRLSKKQAEHFVEKIYIHTAVGLENYEKKDKVEQFLCAQRIIDKIRIKSGA